MNTPQPKITDLAYIHYLCGSPIAEIAVHTGTNSARIQAELDRTPLPPELTPSRS